MIAASNTALKVALLGNGTKPEVVAAIHQLQTELERQTGLILSGIDVSADSDLSCLDADIALIFGGDGTVLHTTRRMGDCPIPVLGVNLGRLGFLADQTPEQIMERLQDLAERNFSIEPLMTLDCTLSLKDGLSVKHRGLNDVVFRAAPPFHLIELSLRIDGESVITYRGDGLIVATPVGSTGHSLSAGGPILPPTEELFVVTPICAHTLTQRPLVDSAHKQFQIRPRSTLDQAITVVIDGQIQEPLAPGDEVIVRRGESSLPMIRLSGHNFYRTLRNKLGWGTDPALDRRAGTAPT